ncbi:MAG TPA: alpha/beta hydrolase [Blastocatellia bacterium]|nr:alpha/beta hydrolase [Blastocatellia bacterium]
MYIERYGSGPEIYLGLHGWSGDHTTFAPLTRLLPAGATLYSVDLPGCGASPALNELTLESVGKAIAETICSIDSAEITVVGSCSGGLYGLVAARDEEARKRVKRFVLIDPYAYFPWYFKIFVAKSLGNIGRYAYYTAFANPVGRWMTNLSLKKHRTEEAHLTQSFTAVNHAIAYRYLQLLADIPGVEWFGDYQMAIDIVCGEKTFGAAKQSARMWQRVWPQARLHELKGAGHLPIEEAAGQLSGIIFAKDSPDAADSPVPVARTSPLVV